jgi:hypothetical protein
LEPFLVKHDPKYIYELLLINQSIAVNGIIEKVAKYCKSGNKEVLYQTLQQDISLIDKDFFTFN